MQVLASCNNLTSIKRKIKALRLSKGTYYISISGLGQQDFKIINIDNVIAICEKALRGKLMHSYVTDVLNASYINIKIYKF